MSTGARLGYGTNENAAFTVNELASGAVSVQVSAAPEHAPPHPPNVTAGPPGVATSDTVVPAG